MNEGISSVNGASPIPLDALPAMSPPAGVQPNFDDPHDEGLQAVALASMFMAFAVIFFSSRVYTKTVIVRNVAWDDCMLLSLPSKSILQPTITFGEE